MSFAFFRRAFGLKKSPEEQQNEEFLRNFNLEVPVNINFLSKSFRKNALRLLVVRNVSESIVYDSILNKEQRQMPTFVKGNEKVTLHEAAFGACPLSRDRELKFSMKLHDFKSSRELLITCVHTPISKRVRCTNSASYAKKPNTFESAVSSRSSTTYTINPSLNEKAIAICLLINLDWIQPLSKSLTHWAPRFTVKSEVLQSANAQRNQGINSGHSFQQTSNAHTELHECLMQRFYCMVFEHFIQLSVMLEALAESIVRILESTTEFTTRSHDGPLLRASYESHTEAHDYINRAFTDFQMAFRDLCIPKLARPVWSTLTLASLAAEQDEINSAESYSETMPGLRSWVNQLPSFGVDLTDSGPATNIAETLTQSFVRGCLCLQISKAVARDRGFFLGQILTGLLMYHQGWIQTVQPKEQGPFSFLRNTCEAFARKDADKFQCTTADSSRSPLNLLLEQLLTQFGCTLNPHDCDNASILNGTGNVFSTTVIHGQQRDRLLALLYICTYFLRAPALLHSRDQLPDLGRADLFELEQQRRRIRHGSKGRRKSGSLLSSTGAAGSGTNVNRGYASSDPHDSGISSQEDLTAAVYSASAGSSPSHPSGMALCLTHKLTQDQCRLAEAAAQYVVNREAAAAAQLGAANRQTGFCPTMYGVTDMSVLSFASSTIPKGHTWTASGHGRLSVAGIFASEAVFGAPVANASISGPSNNNSMRGPQLTEIPLLIEKSFDDTREVCWCLGPRTSPLSSPRPSSPPPTVVSNPTASGPVLSSSSSTTYRRSPNKNASSICSSSVGVPVAQGTTAARLAETPPRMHFSSHFLSSGNSQSTSPAYASPPDLNLSEIGQPALSLDMELGTACYVGMEEPKSSDFDHAFHCQVALGVMDRYTSGLALQATVEGQDSFRQRLQNEMLDWLRYAPMLARRAVCSPTLTGGVAVSSGVNVLKGRDTTVRFPSTSSSPCLKPLHSRASQSPVTSTTTNTAASAITDLTCSALIVNVDTSTVEVRTVGRRCDRPFDSCNHQLSLHNTASYNRPKRGDVGGTACSLSRSGEQQPAFVCDSGSRSSRLANASTVTSAWGHRTSIVGEKSLSSVMEENSISGGSSSTTSSSSSGGCSVYQRTHTIEPAPSLIRLLETVKLLVDRAGCPTLALRHLEAGLQMFYTRSRTLTDLIITEGIGVLSQLDRTTAIVGCLRGDLPLLLSISRSQSCSVAALLQINQVDLHDFR